MSLKQIIIVDEENTVLTIKSSSENEETTTIDDGKRRVEVRTHRSLESILNQFIKEEWSKIKEFGARLVANMPQVYDKEKFKK